MLAVNDFTLGKFERLVLLETIYSLQKRIREYEKLEEHFINTKQEHGLYEKALCAICNVASNVDGNEQSFEIALGALLDNEFDDSYENDALKGTFLLAELTKEIVETAQYNDVGKKPNKSKLVYGFPNKEHLASTESEGGLRY